MGIQIFTQDGIDNGAKLAADLSAAVVALGAGVPWDVDAGVNGNALVAVLKSGSDLTGNGSASSLQRYDHALDADYAVTIANELVAFSVAITLGRDATLPDATTVPVGKVYTVKDEGAGATANNITVKSAGGTIDGVAAATGIAIGVDFGFLSAYSDGTNWFTLGSRLA